MSALDPSFLPSFIPGSHLQPRYGLVEGRAKGIIYDLGGGDGDGEAAALFLFFLFGSRPDYNGSPTLLPH